jgi:hypothetical protein
VPILSRIKRSEHGEINSPRWIPNSQTSIERIRPHGHVAAVLGTIGRLRLEPLLDARRGPHRNAVVAMIAARMLQPRSKLATARELRASTLAHILLGMLAYYVEWHMRQALAPLLFDDDDRAAAEAARGSVVAPPT